MRLTGVKSAYLSWIRTDTLNSKAASKNYSHGPTWSRSDGTSPVKTGRRQQAGGNRQEATGRRQQAGGQ